MGAEGTGEGSKELKGSTERGPAGVVGRACRGKNRMYSGLLLSTGSSSLGVNRGRQPAPSPQGAGWVQGATGQGWQTGKVVKARGFWGVGKGAGGLGE